MRPYPLKSHSYLEIAVSRGNLTRITDVSGKRPGVLFT